MKKILVCFDTDPQPSVFDAVVAVDAGVDQLFRHGAVQPADVRDLVYGAIFTRAPSDLKNTALFIGGSDVAAGEAVLAEIQKTVFGPMRVSAMLDSNGANTTAAAAVLAAARHLDLRGTPAAVVAATGPVGKRAARLLAAEGAEVRVTSRRIESSQAVCDLVRQAVPDAAVRPFVTGDAAAVDGAAVVIAAGPPAVELMTGDERVANRSLRVVIDLNAVDPLGIGGVQLTDKAEDRDGQLCYGALGVGGAKMKIHKAAVAQLFEANDLVLDAAEIYDLGKQLER